MKPAENVRCPAGPSDAELKRAGELLGRQQAGKMTPVEREELQLLVQLDHDLSLAKARTRARRSAAAA